MPPSPITNQPIRQLWAKIAACSNQFCQVPILLSISLKNMNIYILAILLLISAMISSTYWNSHISQSATTIGTGHCSNLKNQLMIDNWCQSIQINLFSLSKTTIIGTGHCTNLYKSINQLMLININQFESISTTTTIGIGRCSMCLFIVSSRSCRFVILNFQAWIFSVNVTSSDNTDDYKGNVD